MENRHGPLVEACLTLADGHAERVAALHVVEPRADRPRAITLGADKAYDAEDFVNELRSMEVIAAPRAESVASLEPVVLTTSTNLRRAWARQRQAARVRYCSCAAASPGSCRPHSHQPGECRRMLKAVPRSLRSPGLLQTHSRLPAEPVPARDDHRWPAPTIGRLSSACVPDQVAAEAFRHRTPAAVSG